ncbi:YiiD C-terminal domain-containing protein [Rubritalea spongiae]|uniref:YiiD C-terminal domain-containing protein n=1 Tax=Rubritalea spongiae TaxID=430797 RepID=A0ABW5E1T2_9BACT
MSEIRLDKVLEYVYEHIPITEHLDARLRKYDGEMLEVTASLEANINHRNSAFGGSMSAIGILSGWALLFIKMRELGLKNKLVIQSSQFQFLEPVVTDFVAISALPEAKDYQRFLKILERKGKARIRIDSSVYDHSGKLCGTHTGEYVAILL